jgi:hypothetical protein
MKNKVEKQLSLKFAQIVFAKKKKSILVVKNRRILVEKKKTFLKYICVKLWETNPQ